MTLPRRQRVLTLAPAALLCLLAWSQVSPWINLVAAPARGTTARSAIVAPGAADLRSDVTHHTAPSIVGAATDLGTNHAWSMVVLPAREAGIALFRRAPLGSRPPPGHLSL